jgi:hypothetical protein
VQQLPFSTHDWVSPPMTAPDTWADVKSPGDGRIYSVGTTKIRTTDGGLPHFSGKPTLPPPLPAPQLGGQVTEKQVVILQVADPDNPAHPDGLAWQRYWFGHDSNISSGLLRPSFARGISVWPAQDPSGAPDDLNTRIAICGETYDQVLPQAATPDRTNFSGDYAAGFIAVYDGNGELLWSYHFYGEDHAASTTITDLSIRVDPVSGRDIVT